MALPFKKDDRVYWSDPEEDLSSGLYTVTDAGLSTDSDAIIFISNGRTEAEVLACELDLVDRPEDEPSPAMR